MALGVQSLLWTLVDLVVIIRRHSVVYISVKGDDKVYLHAKFSMNLGLLKTFHKLLKMECS
jgi:hypothetical protein